MKKTPLVLSLGKTAQLQSSDWIGSKQNVTNVSPTVTDDDTQGYEPLSKWQNNANNKEYTCLSAATGAALWVETTSVSENSNFVFWPSAPAESGIVYKTWANLITAINSLSEGVAPVITFRENFTIPISGMPVGGWNMRRGKWQSPIMATGSVQITVPDGVIIDNLLGGVDVGLLVEFQPTTADGCLTFSDTPGLNLFQVGFGAKVVNTGSKALILSSGTGDTSVFVLNGATIGIPPTDTAPWLKIQGTDGVIGISIIGSLFSQFPNNWLTGGNPGSSLTYNFNVGSITPTLSSWSGDAPTILVSARADKVSYDDSLVPSPSLGSTVQAAIDAIKPLLGGGGGGGGSVFIFDPTVSPSGNIYDDMDALLAAGALIPGPKTIIARNNTSPSTPITVPVGAGAYNFSGYTIRADHELLNLLGFAVEFADGVTMTNFFDVVDCKLVFQNASSFVLTFAGGPKAVRFATYGAIENLGAVNVIQAGISANFYAIVESTNNCFYPTNYEIFGIGHASGTINIFVRSKMCQFFVAGTDLIRGTVGTYNLKLYNGDVDGSTNANFSGIFNLTEYNYKSTGGGGSSAALTTITFDPDIATSTDTNKKTLSEVQTVINAAPGPVQIFVKKNGVLQVAAAGAAAYDFSKVIRITATSASAGVILQFPEGASLVLPTAIRIEGVTIRYTGTSAPLATVSGLCVMVLDYGNIATGAGAGAELIRVPSGNFLYLHMQGETSGPYRGDYEVIDSRGTTVIHVWDKAANGFFATNNIFRNDPGGSGTFQIFSRVLEAAYTATHSNYTDGVDPIPVAVSQIAEDRVNELIEAADKSLPTLYFEPDNGSPSGNHYNDFAVLMAAANALTSNGNIVRLVVVKTGVAQSVAIPTGSYDFSKIKIEAMPETILPNLDFGVGSDATMPASLKGVKIRNFNTAAALITISGSVVAELIDAAIVNATSATQPALSLPSSQALTLDVFSSINPISKEGSGTAPVFCDGDLIINLHRFAGTMLTTNNLFFNNSSEQGSITINSYALVSGGYSRSDTNLDPQVGYVSMVEPRVDERVAAVRPVVNSGFGTSPVVFSDFSFVGTTAPVGAPAAGWKWNSINGITNLQLLAPFTTPGVDITEVTFTMPGAEDSSRPPLCSNFPIFFKGTVNQTTECKVEFQRTFGGTNRIKFIFDAPVALNHLYCNLTYGSA